MQGRSVANRALMPSRIGGVAARSSPVHQWSTHRGIFAARPLLSTALAPSYWRADVMAKSHYSSSSNTNSPRPPPPIFNANQQQQQQPTNAAPTQQQQSKPSAKEKDTELAYEVNEANFMAKVIEASKATPIVVDLYADWCGPCKKLTPLLIAEANRTGIPVAKLNIDFNPNIAQQLQAASVPTVVIAFQGKLMPGFTGLLPSDQLTKLFDQLVQIKLQVKDKISEEEKEAAAMDALAQKIEEGQHLLDQGDYEAASRAYNDVLVSQNEQLAPFALAGLAQCALAEDNMQGATEVVKLIKSKYPASVHSPDVAKAISAVELRTQLLKDAPEGITQSDIKKQQQELRDKLKENPEDLQARYDLALSLSTTGASEEAVEELLNHIKKDKNWQEQAARKLLIKVLDALGPDSALAKDARKRLSLAWFV